MALHVIDIDLRALALVVAVLGLVVEIDMDVVDVIHVVQALTNKPEPQAGSRTAMVHTSIFAIR